MEIGKGSNAEHVAEEEAVSTALAEYHATLARWDNQGCPQMDKAQNETALAAEAENTEVKFPHHQDTTAAPRAVIAMLKARTSDSDESEVTLRKPSMAARAGLKVEPCTQEDYYEAPSRDSNSSSTLNTTSPVQRQTFNREAVFDLDADELHTLTDLKAGPSPAPAETSASMEFRKRAKDQRRFERVVEGRANELGINRTAGHFGNHHSEDLM